MRQHIPNFFTLSNLLCGCCALLYTLNSDPATAAWLVLGCFVFDYADGMSARALGVSSPLGKQLDSLADTVSFGVVPAAMLYMVARPGLCGADLSIPLNGVLELLNTKPVQPAVCFGALPAFVLAAFAAMRLGRFNIDPRQSKYFIGLSTPGCTVFVLGVALAADQNRFGLRETLGNQWFIYGLVGVLSWLMNSEIPMFGMKVRSYRLRDNAFTLAFLATFFVLLYCIHELAFSVVIMLYILSSILLKDKILAPSTTA